MRPAVWDLIWICISVHSTSVLGNNDLYVTVSTMNGNVTGTRKHVLGKPVFSFLGIPYAKPPIGRLRFRNPEPVNNWTEPFLATTHSKTCYQNLPEPHELNNAAWRVWINNTEMSEDCLYLSIWTPSLPQKMKNEYGLHYSEKISESNEDVISTLVWIHGGGFTSGSGTLDLYNGEILASKMNVIVINIQYRVGPFGFLSFNNKNIPGNQGLMDQVMALKWINDNIIYFGGSQKYITLFGANSGAVSASFHLLSPLTQKLFNQAIMQSGSALSWWSYESPKVAVSKAYQFANISGCYVNKELMINNDLDIYECLRSLDPVTIVVNQWKVLNERYRTRHTASMKTPASFYFDIPFKPINESEYLPMSPSYYLENNYTNILKKRVMLGTTKNEGLVYLFRGFRAFFMPSEDSLIQPPQFRHDSNAMDPVDMIAFYLTDEKYFQYFLVEAIAFEYQLPGKLWSIGNWKSQDIIDVFDNIVGDFSFKCPVVDFADLYLKINKVYLYSFEHQTKNLPLPQWTGVLQGQEIAYIFGRPFDVNFSNKYYNFTDEERELSTNMMMFWTNFAQTGYPNSRMKEYHTKIRDKHWEMYADSNFDKDNRQHIVMQNKTVYTGRNFRRHECLFWRKYLPLIKHELMKKRAMCKKR